MTVGAPGHSPASPRRSRVLRERSTQQEQPRSPKSGARRKRTPTPSQSASWCSWCSWWSNARLQRSTAANVANMNRNSSQSQAAGENSWPSDERRRATHLNRHFPSGMAVPLAAAARPRRVQRLGGRGRVVERPRRHRAPPIAAGRGRRNALQGRAPAPAVRPLSLPRRPGFEANQGQWPSRRRVCRARRPGDALPHADRGRLALARRAGVRPRRARTSACAGWVRIRTPPSRPPFLRAPASTTRAAAIAAAWRFGVPLLRRA